MVAKIWYANREMKKIKQSTKSSKKVKSNSKSSASNKANFAAKLKESAKKSNTSSKVSSSFLAHMTFMQLTKLFWVWFFVQAIVLFIVRSFFPANVVLGTDLISPFMAVLYSMLVLTLFCVGAIPFVELVQDLFKKRFGTSTWMVLFIGINTVGLWVISRFPVTLGLGLSSWVVVLALGVLFSFVQGFFAMRLGKE